MFWDKLNERFTNLCKIMNIVYDGIFRYTLTYSSTNENSSAIVISIFIRMNTDRVYRPEIY